jgi:hypothetical protein
MTQPERILLIEMLANIDEITELLTPEQMEKANKNFRKIYGNYHNLLEGLGEETK